MQFSHNDRSIRRRNTSVLGFLATAAISSLVLAGCAGAGPSTDPGASGGGGGEGSNEVTVSLIPNQMYTAIAPYGESMGIYEEHGITLSYASASNSPAIATAVASNAADVGLAPADIAASAMQQGGKMSLLMNNYNFDFSVLVQPDIPDVSGDYKAKVTALQGMRIGVTGRGALSERYFTQMLVNAGLTGDAVSYVAVGAGIQALSALENDTIDALVTLSPYETFLGPDKAKLFIPASVGAEELYDGLIYTAWWASSNLVSERPEVASNFCAATLESLNSFVDPANTDQAVTFLTTFLNIEKPAAEQAYETWKSNFTPHVDEAMWNEQGAMSNIEGLQMPEWSTTAYEPCVSLATDWKAPVA